MGKGRERRELRRAKRRDARIARQEARRASKTERQANRQGFLSGIIGDEGLGGLADDFGFGGGGDLPPTKDDDGKEESNMMMYALIGLGAYMLMQKK